MTRPWRMLMPVALALALGWSMGAWGQDGFGGAAPPSAGEEPEATPAPPPPVVPDGMYSGEFWKGDPRIGGPKATFPLRVTLRGTEFSGRCKVRDVDYQIRGTYDRQRGVISGNIHGTSPFTDQGRSYTARYDVPFQGTIKNGQLRVQGHGETEGLPGYIGPTAAGFRVTFGEPETPPPGPRIGLQVTIHHSPEQPKPGDQVTVWADITDTEGKPVSGARKVWSVGKYAGDADPRFTWDGKELPIALIVIHNDNEYKFAQTLPAYGAAPQAGVIPGLGGAGKVPGPASILSGIVGTLVPGVIGILGGLVGGLRRGAPPSTPRPPAPRGPRRRPPPPPPARQVARAPAKPLPPPPKRAPKPPPPPDEATRLKNRLDELEKRAKQSGNDGLRKWVENTRKEAFNPDGSVNREKISEARSKLGEALNMPGEPVARGLMGHVKDTILGAKEAMDEVVGLGLDMGKTVVGLGPGARDYGDALINTAKELADERDRATRELGGFILSIPEKTVDGLKVIGKTVRDAKYIGRALNEKADDWLRTHGAAEIEAFGKALADRRYLDAIGNVLKIMGKGGLELGGKAWEVAKEFLPVDEIGSFFNKNASMEERLWAFPSAVIKTVGLLMGTQGGRNVLSKPVSSLPRTAANSLKSAGETIAGKWTELQGPPRLPAQPTRLGGALGKLQDTVDDIVRTTDPAEQARKVQEIYRDGGMDKLKKLQQAGGLSAKQAETLNTSITNTVNEAVDKSVRGTVGNFHKSTGVRVKEVIVADSGSSAAGGPRSIYTDADRTKIISFDPDDLKAYAAKHGVSEAKAYNDLSDKLMSQISRGVEKRLKRVGLTEDDVGYGSYKNLGSDAGGKGDAFPQSWTEQNTLKQCKAKSYAPDGQGGARSHDISGRQVVDEGQMIRQKYGNGQVGDAKKTFGDSRAVLAQQAATINKAGASMDKVAKTVLRTGQETALRGRPLDPELLRISHLVKQNPQNINQILAANHLTEEAFRSWGRSAVNGANEWMRVQ